MGKIILASSSPRRAKILKEMNINFEVLPSSYVEQHDKTDFSYEFVEELAYNKALYVAKELNQENKYSLVLGADTIVVIDDKILGKPTDKKEAYYMLEKLSNRTHFVVTAVAVVNSKTMEFKVESATTYVTFEDLTSEQIHYYIENFKPYDKAGAYGIQELPQGYIKEVNGEIDNVIGLPSKTVKKLLDEMQ